MTPNRVNPHQENKQNSQIFCIFPAHGKIDPKWPQMRTGRFFSYLSRPCRHVWRHGFVLDFLGGIQDFQNSRFLDFQISRFLDHGIRILAMAGRGLGGRKIHGSRCNTKSGRSKELGQDCENPISVQRFTSVTPTAFAY